MELVLRLHSTVSVITNSSTVIYTSATEQTVGALKEAIGSLLKAVGVSVSVDELFDVRIDYSEWSWEKMRRIYMLRHSSFSNYKDADDVYNGYLSNNPWWWNDDAEIGLCDEPMYVIISSKQDNQDLVNFATMIEKMFTTITAESYSTD